MKRIWINSLALVVWPLLSVACHDKPKAESDAKVSEGKDSKESGKGDKGGKDGKRNSGLVSVRVATVERKVQPRVIYAASPFTGKKQAEVYSKVAGRISALGPKEGQPIKEGQMLFKVDRSDPGETYLNAPTLSPLTGWIGRWRVDNVGENVTPTDSIVTVVDDSALRVIAFMPASDWVDVRPETKVTVSVDNKERAGKVLFIARAADLTSGRGSVTVEVPNEKRDWRSGMFARVKFELMPKERIIISAASLIITDQGAFVYVVDQDKAKRLPVEFQVIDSDTVEITKGLEPNQKIVVAGANLLGNESDVKIVE